MDTNTIIDFLIGNLSLTARDKILQIEPVISVITQIELFSYSKTPIHELLQLESFISIATIYDHINEHIVGKAISLRQLYKLKTPDAIIAATAITYNLTLISRNTKDFDQVKELTLINPWQM